MGCALVGGYSKQKKSDSCVWRDHDKCAADLLAFKNFCRNIMMNMKRKYVITFLMVISATLLLQCGRHERVKTETKQHETESAVNERPGMPVTFPGGEKANVSQFSGKIILILFQPDCDHCQREATAIRENLDSFKDYTLYFISSASLSDMQQFAAEYKLKASNIRFAQTTVESIINNFGSIPAPSVYIYSEEGKLVQKFNGETGIENILNHL